MRQQRKAEEPLAAIVMRQVTTIIILTLISVTAFGQKRKLPPKDTYYPISKVVYAFPRQEGKLDVIKNDSVGQTIYKTDSSEILVSYDCSVSFLAGWDNKDKSAIIHYRLDSIVTLLFQNGLLTSDQLIKSFNTEAKYIDHKGDTVDLTHHIKTETVILRYIRQQEFNKFVKRKKGALLFEAAVTFKEDIEPYQFPAIHNFVFYLQGDFNPSSSTLTEYLKTAKIKCLRYKGTQI